MYCRNCGNKLNEDSKFCGKCGYQVSDNVINNVMPNMPPAPPKTNKTAIAIAIGYGAFLVLIFIISFLITFIAAFSEGFDYEEDNTQTGIKTLVNEELSFKYESSIWQETESEEPNAKVVANYYSAIAIGVTSSNYYYTTHKFAEEQKKYFINQGAVILEDLEEIEINNQIWEKLVYKNNGYIIFELFLSNDYDNYSFAYTAMTMSTYEEEQDELENVYMTLKLDTTEQEESEKKAKENLIGEWDWGTSGYFVIEDEKIYLYKDSTKDLANVFIGTYNAKDKIATNAAGYVDGMYILFTIDEYYVEGNKVELSANQMEFAFTPNQNGTYTVDNLNSYNTGIATKVK